MSNEEELKLLLAKRDELSRELIDQIKRRERMKVAFWILITSAITALIMTAIQIWIES